MKLHQQIATNNDCYKAGKKITVKGLMLHSTGANNPNLRRYVGPDDGTLGTPSPGNFNQPKPGGRQVCPHGWIGKDKDGGIRTYQTLPWNHRGWHGGGSSNDTHIGIEICEDDLTNAEYFAAVYQEAVEVFAFLCKEFNLNPDTDIITHSEGYKKGIASNHADVMHWFPRHGKSMDTFRADVKALVNDSTPAPTPASQPAPRPVQKSIEQLAQEVIKGLHGSGDARRKALGYQYDAVQTRVNEILGGSKPAPAPQPARKQAPATKTIILPSSAATWRVYPVNKAPVKANAVAMLRPSKFGGLSYAIVTNGSEPHTYIIDTSDFGRVKIYGHPSTGAVIK